MKPAQSPQAALESPVRVEFKVRFVGGSNGRRRAKEIQSTESPEQETPAISAKSSATEPVKRASPNHFPKIARLLVLGHHFEMLVREGVVKDYTEIARLTGLTRARVTQIVNLTMLAPKIQEAILNLPMARNPKDRPTESELRMVVAHSEWRNQHQAIDHRILCPAP